MLLQKVMADSRKKYTLSDSDFVVAWTRAADLKEFSKQTGIPGPSASAWASKLRSRGIRLKEMSRGVRRKCLEVNALNDLIARTEAETRGKMGE